MDAAVYHRFLHRLQTRLAAHNQLHQGQDEVALECQGVIILGVVEVQIHGIDVLVGRGRNIHHLAAQPPDQGGILVLRVYDKNIILGNQESVGDLALGAERLAAVVDNQAVFQQEVSILRHCEVIDRDFLRQIQRCDPDGHMAAAEALAFANRTGFDILAVCVQNQVCVRTPQFCSILQLNDFQCIHILLDANVLCLSVYNLAAFIVIGFY